jgi:hypothetical protein
MNSSINMKDHPHPSCPIGRLLGNLMPGLRVKDKPSERRQEDGINRELRRWLGDRCGCYDLRTLGNRWPWPPRGGPADVTCRCSMCGCLRNGRWRPRPTMLTLRHTSVHLLFVCIISESDSRQCHHVKSQDPCLEERPIKLGAKSKAIDH